MPAVAITVELRVELSGVVMPVAMVVIVAAVVVVLVTVLLVHGAVRHFIQMNSASFLLP